MKYIYRSITAKVFLFAAILTSQTAYSQKSHQEREREELARATQLNHVNLSPQLVTSTQFQLPAPTIINFTQVAEWERSHQQTRPVPRDVEQGEEKFEGYKRPPMPISPNAVHANVTTTINTEKTNSPAPLLSFNGVLGDGSVVPPDIEGATGLNYVFETDNQSFAIYTKTGTLQNSVNIGNFFGSVGNGYFDPHCLYDPIRNRFLVMIDGNIASNGDGGLFLAISQTSDPTGNWYVYSIDGGDNSSNDLLDFPLMGFNTNWVVLTANDFIGGNVTTDIWVMNRASLYSGTQGTVTKFTDNNAFSLSPAQTMDSTQTTEYLVQNGGNGSSVQVGTITGAVGSPTYSAGNQLTLSQTWNETTVQAAQQGGNTLDNDDTRIYASVLINGSLWFSHTVFLPANNATYSGVDWAQINPATLAVQQYNRLSDPNGAIFYYYPAINVNSAGDALLQFDVSSSSEYSSAGYCFHAASDAANVMEAPYVYKAGIANYAPTGFGSDLRWGDYNGAAVDPSDNSFWGFGQWANNSNLWGTQIVHVGPSVPPHNPPVASFAADVTTTCTGVVQFSDQSSNVPTSWLWNFGDSTTSTAQNPTHDYTTNGTYTVTLTATNQYGSNSATVATYITVNEPAAPTANNVTHCGPSTFSLSASTTNPVNWFDSTGNFVSSNNPFVTPTLTHTTTYYVQDTVIAPAYDAGPLTDGIGTGGYLNSNWALIFDVMKSGTLVSVVVYANGAGTRTFQLTNSGGTILASTTVNCPNGQSTVTLNFPLTVGTGYNLGISGTINLYRNNAGAAYPYTDADGIVSITGNTATGVPTYYYYFYDWKVKEQNCISQRGPVRAIVDATINASNITSTPVACNGGSNGSATITPTGGTPAFTYHWSNSQTTPIATNLSQGTYTVTITDAASCTAVATTMVSQPTALSVTVTPTNAPCGTSNGSASAVASGGTSGYTYAWSGGGSGSSVSSLATGNYTLTVTDAHLCSVTSAFTITSSGSLGLTATETDASCYGASTGSAGVTVTGGTGTITYDWSNGQHSATINNVPAGIYTVTVSDGSGCSATSSKTVSEPTAVNVSVTPINTGCGSPNGSATAVATGGTPSYTYLWSNAATTPSISGLSAGTYTVTVTDNHTCTTTSTAVVNSTGLLNVSGTSADPSCYGAATGSATATIAGGTSPFTYTWSNSGGNTATISNVASGTYTVTVVDNTGCSGTSSINVSQPTAVAATTTSTAAGCGTSSGTATVVASGGTPGYTYNWSFNSSTNATISNLSAGAYLVTVTDANSCTTTASIVVTGGSALTLTASTSPATCYNGLTGSASVLVTSGTGPYTYAWSNGAGNASSLNNIAAGNYIITITDGNSCQRIDTLVVSEPSSITVSVNTVEPTCAGLNNGSASVTATGGTGSFTYSWSTSSTANSISNLQPGNYSVTVQDANSCTSNSNFVISNPAPVDGVINSVNDSCNGVNDGTAQVTPSGGTGPYTYAWSNNATAGTINNLPAGLYTVTITDSHNCTATSDVTVTEPSAITITTTSTNATNGLSNGTATVSNISGGVPPYSIVSWSNGAIANTTNSLAAGTYTVTVKDNNGCEQSASVTITSVILGIVNVPGELAFSIYPNPAKTEITVDATNLDKESAIVLEDMLGQTLMIRTLTSVQAQTKVDLSTFADGVYFIELRQGEKHVVKKFIINR